MIVILKFRKREEIVPVIWALVDKHPQVLFELLIDPLRLTVRLRVVGRGRRESDT